MLAEVERVKLCENNRLIGYAQKRPSEVSENGHSPAELDHRQGPAAAQQPSLTSRA
jgi:hypothetical protein